MDFLYKLFSDGNSKAIETHRRVVYKQVSLCCEDVSITKIPILRQNAGVTLVILKAIQAIKFSKDEFQALANHAADLIVGIWRSYKKAKVPEQWLSPPLRDILRGLLENLCSMLGFFEEQASTNMFFRLFMSDATDMRQINKFHQRLTITLDKFEIQSHISSNRLLIQLLEEQKEMSNQIQQRNGVKNIAAKRDNNSKAKTNKVIGVSTTQRTGLDRTAKKPVKKIARKIGQHTPSSKVDWLSEPEEPSPPSITPWKKTRSPINVVLPPTSHWPWSTDECYTSGNWTLSPYPAIVSFSSSGKGVIINQRAGNVAHSNFLNVGHGNERSAHCYRYHSG